MKGLIPTLLCDFYKISHKDQYPDKTEIVYSTWTPRSGKYSNTKNVVSFGFQGFIKEYLLEYFNENFFNRDIDSVTSEYSRYLKHCLFIKDVNFDHIVELHSLGYLPLMIKAVDEGTITPFRVPVLTIENTDSRFYWLTNYFETLISSLLWKPCTVASIAINYKSVLNQYAIDTTGSIEGVEFQAHDFSMRGMSGLEDAARSGAGHLLSFVGTDTIPAIQYLEQYYNANIELELVGCSVSATEHSVMCAGGKVDELKTYERLISKLYPTGIISIVSDTWDLWHVLTDTLPKLKGSILSRDGGDGSIDKVVIRPDSGDPETILCGDKNKPNTTPEGKGVVQLLWETFGGTETKQGYKVLDSHIGVIYGDAITIERCTSICERLKESGFASVNVIFGIGSYSYQYITRDTLGFAMKSTSVTIDGKRIAIFKDPKTDDGVKKSAKGRVKVYSDKFGEITYQDEIDEQGSLRDDILTTVFSDGLLIKETSLTEIRSRLDNK